jgi:hypothetical protein
MKNFWISPFVIPHTLLLVIRNSFWLFVIHTVPLDEIRVEAGPIHCRFLKGGPPTSDHIIRRCNYVRITVLSDLTPYSQVVLIDVSERGLRPLRWRKLSSDTSEHLPDRMALEIWNNTRQIGARKSPVFLDIMPCSPLKVNRCFGGTCLSSLQGWRVNQEKSQRKTAE